MRLTWLIALGVMLVGGLQAQAWDFQPPDKGLFVSADGTEYARFGGFEAEIRRAGSEGSLWGIYQMLDSGEIRVVTTEKGRTVATYYYVTDEENLRTESGKVLLQREIPESTNPEALLKSKRARTAGNLMQLGLGFLMYTGDHKGNFPEPNGAAGLQVMKEKQYFGTLAATAYLSYLDTRQPTAEGAPITEATTSFAYVGAGLKDDNEHFGVLPILIEKPTSDDWMHILFLDGHVEGFDVEEKSMEAAVKAMIKAKTKAGIKIPVAVQEDILKRASAADRIEAAEKSH